MIVGRGFTSNNASKENNRIFYYACIRAKLLKMKLQRMNGELGEGVVENKNYFQFPHFLFRSDAAEASHGLAPVHVRAAFLGQGSHSRTQSCP